MTTEGARGLVRFNPLFSLLAAVVVPVLGGCGRGQWVTASAAVVPNPVLFGPVTYVRSANAPDPGTVHPFPGVVTALATKHVASQSEVHYGGSSTTTTTMTMTSGGLQLGVDILDRATEHRFFGSTFSSFNHGLVAAHDRDFWHEPYRVSDVIVFETFAVSATRKSVTDFGSSDVKDSTMLVLSGDKLIHAGVPAAPKLAP